MLSKEELSKVDSETVAEKTTDALRQNIKRVELKFKLALMAVILLIGVPSFLLLKPEASAIESKNKYIRKLKSKNTKLVKRNEYQQHGIRLYEAFAKDITGIETAGHFEGEEFVWYLATGPGTLTQIKQETGEETEEEIGGELTSFHNHGQRQVK